MKKAVLTLVVVLVGLVGFSQTNNQKLKYVTTAPDGTVAMTVLDDLSSNDIKLESANDFYRYEILEPTTAEAVYESTNMGKECTIDKSQLSAGTYDIRLYTSNFVITSKITISASRKIHSPAIAPAQDAVAARD